MLFRSKKETNMATYTIEINGKQYVVEAVSLYQAHGLAANLAASGSSI